MTIAETLARLVGGRRDSIQLSGGLWLYYLPETEPAAGFQPWLAAYRRGHTPPSVVEMETLERELKRVTGRPAVLRCGPAVGSGSGFIPAWASGYELTWRPVRTVRERKEIYKMKLKKDTPIAIAPLSHFVQP